MQITAAETVGVEQRGKFYEATGTLRDMVPNHLLALLSMVAMEPPTGFDADSIRAKRTDVFAAISPVDPSRAVRGQYDASEVLGKPVQAYRKEPNVVPDSKVETYVAMQFEIDNWRWAGVPFLCQDRQAPESAMHGDRDQLQAGALRGVPRYPGRGPPAELAGASRNAGRGDIAAVRGETSRAIGRTRAGEDGFSLRRLVRAGGERWLRDADPRCHDRQSDPVHARRHCRTHVADRSTGARRLGRLRSGNSVHSGDVEFMRC